jgi:uncharacterized membrane protein
VPVVCVLAGGALSFSTIAIDRAADYELVPETLTGGPDAALAILTTVATSMLSLTALVLTITMVVVQLAMGQFSPRIVQTFLQDKPSQFAIGLFVATFAHSMLAMREVRFGSSEAVPGLAIVVAYGLVVVCIVVLVLYVHHIGQSLRVASLIELVGQGTRRVMDEMYPDLGPAGGEDRHVVCAQHSGVVTQVDVERVVALAEAQHLTLAVVPTIGDFVPAGSAVFRSSTALPDEIADELRRLVLLGLERTLDHDIAYGFRMLVDVAERAVAESPFLDPTTAVQAIDRLHDCLRQLVPRTFPSGEVRDSTGTVRLSYPIVTWDDYVHLAFDELVRAGRSSPPVYRRIRQALLDLRSIAPPDRIAVLDDVFRDLVSDNVGDGTLVLDPAG